MNHPRRGFKARRAQSKVKRAPVQQPVTADEASRPQDRHSRRLARKQHYRQTGEIA